MIKKSLKSFTSLEGIKRSPDNTFYFSNALYIKDKFNTATSYSSSIEKSFQLFNDTIISNIEKVTEDMPCIYKNLIPDNSFTNRLTSIETLPLHKLFFSDEFE